MTRLIGFVCGGVGLYVNRSTQRGHQGIDIAFTSRGNAEPNEAAARIKGRQHGQALISFKNKTQKTNLAAIDAKNAGNRLHVLTIG
jgi:hypothetical protein